MKTIMKDNIKEGEPASSYIRRVKDGDASKYVNQEQVTEESWHYVSKGVWKEKVRDVNKKEESSKKKKGKKDEQLCKGNSRTFYGG